MSQLTRVLTAFVVILGCLAAWSILVIFLVTDAADAAQPYGGCKEAWQAAHSAGAEECRSKGWTVRERLVVTPYRKVVYSALPSCTYEDASSGPVPCSWNFGTTDGNGKGDAYYVTGTHRHRHFHYVKR